MIHPPKSWAHRARVARRKLARAAAYEAPEGPKVKRRARGINRQSVHNYLDTLRRVREGKT